MHPCSLTSQNTSNGLDAAKEIYSRTFVKRYSSGKEKHLPEFLLKNSEECLREEAISSVSEVGVGEAGIN